MALFFVSCPLGFEDDLARELKTFWFEMLDLDGQPTRHNFPEVEKVDGGLELDVPEHLGYQINFFTKIASRVLIRIAKFESRYFDQFERELKKIDLGKWLDKQNGLKLQVKIESHRSRLNHEKNLLEAVQNVLESQKIKASSEAGDFILFIRLEKDRVMVSLDTSGEHLHRRGYAKYRGEAPLRENLAGYVIAKLSEYVDLQTSFNIIDPFAGSGTLLFEAASFFWPLFDRPYAWLKFKNRPKLFQSETWAKNYKWIQRRQSLDLIALDQDPQAIQSLLKNSEIFKKIFSLEAWSIQTAVADSLNVDWGVYNLSPKTWVVTNPPYGHRLSEGAAVQILQRLEAKATPEGMILIHPESWKFDFRQLQCVWQNDFNNQGLKLKLSVFKR